MRWGAGCLALRTRFKNYFIPGGTLPTHLVCSQIVDMYVQHDGLLIKLNTHSYITVVELPDLEVNFLFLRHHFYILD